MSESLRRNLSRASTRPSLYGPPGNFSSAHGAPEKEASEILEIAKKDLEKLKKKEKKKKKRCVCPCFAFVFLCHVQTSVSTPMVKRCACVRLSSGRMKVHFST